MVQLVDWKIPFVHHLGNKALTGPIKPIAALYNVIKWRKRYDILFFATIRACSLFSSTSGGTVDVQMAYGGIIYIAWIQPLGFYIGYYAYNTLLYINIYYIIVWNSYKSTYNHVQYNDICLIVIWLNISVISILSSADRSILEYRLSRYSFICRWSFRRHHTSARWTVPR